MLRASTMPGNPKIRGCKSILIHLYINMNLSTCPNPCGTFLSHSPISRTLCSDWIFKCVLTHWINVTEVCSSNKLWEATANQLVTWPWTSASISNKGFMFWLFCDFVLTGYRGELLKGDWTPFHLKISQMFLFFSSITHLAVKSWKTPMLWWFDFRLWAVNGLLENPT